MTVAVDEPALPPPPPPPEEASPTAAVPTAPAEAVFARRAWRASLLPLFRRPMVLLVLITLLGATLRLVSLDRPALWGDEAFTFSRVCGTYRQMLGILQTDGFMPLHYSLYWWIGQHWDLSPIAMRLPVAIAGILMPPAMYFLSRQMRLPLRTALLVALFTACSAYMLTYSRDAKMYMPFWTAAAAHVGCLLWWLNGVRATERRSDDEPGAGLPLLPPAHFRCLCWLAAGMAMVGFHRLGVAVLGVEALMLLCWLARPWAWSRRSLWTLGRVVPSFAMGAAMLYGATWVHNTHFSKFDARAADEWHTTGLGWVPAYNAERDGWDHVKFTATAFAFSWEWPNRSKIPGVDPRAMKLLSAAAVVLGLAAVVGVLPWRRRTPPPGTPGGGGGEGALPLPAPSAVAKEPLPQPSPGVPGEGENWPRTLFFILAWLLVPTYAVYCRSIQPFATPWAIVGDWAAWLRDAGWIAAAVGTAAVALALWRCGRTWRGRGMAAVWLVVVLAAVFGVLCAEYAILQYRWDLARAAKERWANIWMPRYLGFVWPAFAIGLCVLLARLPTRPLRWGAIGLLIFVNLVQFSVRTWGGSEPRTDLLTADLAAAQPMHVRGQQLAADIWRQTFAAVWGQPTRSGRITEQAAKLPLVEPDTRVYVQTGAWSPEPGGGVMGSFAARYYMAWRVGIETYPREFRRFRNVVDRQWLAPMGISPRPVAADMNGAKYAKIRRLITWDRIDPSARDAGREDPLGKALGDAWRRVDEDLYAARDHWTWRHMYSLRRREYLRVKEYVPPPPPAPKPAATRPAATAPATTQPATAPSS